MLFFLLRTVKLFIVFYERDFVLFSSLMCCNDVGKTFVIYPGGLGVSVPQVHYQCQSESYFLFCLKHVFQTCNVQCSTLSHIWLLSMWNVVKSNLRCALSIKYIIDFKDVVWEKRMWNSLLIFISITFWSHILDILDYIKCYSFQLFLFNYLFT